MQQPWSLLSIPPSYELTKQCFLWEHLIVTFIFTQSHYLLAFVFRHLLHLTPSW